MQFQKKSIPYSYGRSLEIPRGRGVLEAKILEAKYEAKLEFPEGRGYKIKNLLWGEYGYFLELHIIRFNSCLENSDFLFPSLPMSLTENIHLSDLTISL